MKDSDSLVYHVYKRLYDQTVNAPQIKSWASEIKKELNNMGLGNLWISQFERIPQFSVIKQRIRDQYIQTWNASLNSMSKLESYSRYKKTFEMEKYLQILSNDTLRKHLSAFRLVSHRLEIEIGRHNNIPREQRICKICNMQQTESEYHFLLVCPAYHDLRTKYLPRSFLSWPTLQKFDSLMKHNGNKMLSNIAKFIAAANKLRSEIVGSR